MSWRAASGTLVLYTSSSATSASPNVAGSGYGAVALATTPPPSRTPSGAAMGWS